MVEHVNMKRFDFIDIKVTTYFKETWNCLSSSDIYRTILNYILIKKFILQMAYFISYRISQAVIIDCDND